MAARYINSVVVALVMPSGETATGKQKYKTMSVGKLSVADYFPDRPSTDNDAELTLVAAVANALNELTSTGASEIREVITSAYDGALP